MSRILAVDPGNVESAYIVTHGYRPHVFGKLPNEDLLDRLARVQPDEAAIEMVASYGMPVGFEVFDTCVWIGRFTQVLAGAGVRTRLVRRLPIKLHHCHSQKAGDAHVRQALVDRFAPGVSNYGKGTKKQPGWFYGFREDVWQAYALAVFVADESGEPASGVVGPPAADQLPLGVAL